MNYLPALLLAYLSRPEINKQLIRNLTHEKINKTLEYPCTYSFLPFYDFTNLNILQPTALYGSIEKGVTLVTIIQPCHCVIIHVITKILSIPT